MAYMYLHRLKCHTHMVYICTAAVAHETTVLSATDSVVVEQVNVLPGEDVGHLVVGSSTGHLVEIRDTNAVQQVYVPCVQQIITNQEDWNRQHQV